MEFLIAAVVLWVFFAIMIAWVKACCRVGNTIGHAIKNASKPREECAFRASEADTSPEPAASATAK